MALVVRGLSIAGPVASAPPRDACARGIATGLPFFTALNHPNITPALHGHLIRLCLCNAISYIPVSNMPISEADVLKPVDPSITDSDDWEIFVLSDAQVVYEGNGKPASLLAAYADTPLRVEGRLEAPGRGQTRYRASCGALTFARAYSLEKLLSTDAKYSPQETVQTYGYRTTQRDALFLRRNDGRGIHNMGARQSRLVRDTASAALSAHL